MKKTYKIKAVKRTWIEVTADGSLSQDEIYELAKEKASKRGVKWEDPSFSIVSIDIDDTAENAKTKIIASNTENKEESWFIMFYMLSFNL